jgi:hypothetical protein
MFKIVGEAQTTLLGAIFWASQNIMLQLDFTFSCAYFPGFFKIYRRYALSGKRCSHQ